MFCNFISIGPDEYICPDCNNRVVSPNGPPMFPCSRILVRETNNDIGFITKLKNFATSTMNHIGNGLPLCSDEQIINRHNICMSCEYFKDNTCTQCGCPLFRTKKFVSKLAWADEECPVGKWHKETS